MDLKLKRQLCQMLKDKIDAGSFNYNNGDDWYTEDFNFTKVIPNDLDIEYYTVESEYEMSSKDIDDVWDGYFGADSSTLGEVMVESSIMSTTIINYKIVLDSAIF